MVIECSKPIAPPGVTCTHFAPSGAWILERPYFYEHVVLTGLHLVRSCLKPRRDNMFIAKSKNLFKKPRRGDMCENQIEAHRNSRANLTEMVFKGCYLVTSFWETCRCIITKKVHLTSKSVLNRLKESSPAQSRGPTALPIISPRLFIR